MLTTDSPCDVNTMMMVNRKMLDDHKKIVENKLQMEVAHSVKCLGAQHACHNSGHVTCVKETRDIGHTCQDHQDPLGLGRPGPSSLTRNVKNASKRFFPHLEPVPEESRNNTVRSSVQMREGDTGSSGSVDTEAERDQEMSYPANTQESGANNSNPRSMDSGIATRYGQLLSTSRDSRYRNKQKCQLPQLKVVEIFFLSSDPRVHPMNILAITRQRQQAAKVSSINIFDMARPNIFRTK